MDGWAGTSATRRRGAGNLTDMAEGRLTLLISRTDTGQPGMAHGERMRLTVTRSGVDTYRSRVYPVA